MRKNLLKALQVLQKIFYVTLLVLGIYTFTYKKPFFIALGAMLLLWGFLLSPLMNKTFDNPKLSFVQKLLIFIGIYIIMAYSVSLHSNNYCKTFITFFTMIEYFIMIVVQSSKKNQKKNEKV